MDEPHLLAAACYVELNPVRARLAERAGDWRWSSTRAQLDGRDDALMRVAPLVAPAPDREACRSTRSTGLRLDLVCAPRRQTISRTPALAAFRASSPGRARILSPRRW